MRLERVDLDGTFRCRGRDLEIITEAASHLNSNHFLANLFRVFSAKVASDPGSWKR